MRHISFDDDPHKQQHFDFFRRMDDPHFGVTADVDITDLRRIVRASPTLRFTPAVVYLIGRAAMEVTPFRWRIRKDRVIEHDRLRPSFAVPVRDSAAFSFYTVTYQEDVEAFHADCVATMDAMYDNPSFEDEPGADDYLYLSTFPWASFTSVKHAMHNSPGDSVPRIVWGKYRKIGDRTIMPLSVQAHHAVVDGSDLGHFYQVFDKNLRACEEIFAPIL